MSSIIFKLVNQSRFQHLSKSVNPQVYGWTRCLLSRQYFHVQRQHNLLGKQLKCACYSSVGQGGGRFNNPLLNKIERLLDRLQARWLYFRYEGSFGPPESVSVKQKRKLRALSLSLGFILLVVYAIGRNFNPHAKYPVFLGVKLWPDNIEEYRDILDATSSKRPPRSPSPSTKTTTT